MAQRRNLDETRRLLLDAGVDTFAQDGIAVGLNSTFMIDVCRAVGLSTAGSAYKIWPSQDEFRTDVLRHLLTLVTPRTETDPNVTAIASQAVTLQSDPTDFVRQAANATICQWRSQDLSRRIFLTLVLAATRDPVIATGLHDHDLASLDEHAALYEVIARAYGREWTSPYDAKMLATVLAALLEGMAIRGATVPLEIDEQVVRPTGPNGEDRLWTLYACAADALIMAFTHDRPTSAQETDATRGDDLESAVESLTGNLGDAEGAPRHNGHDDGPDGHDDESNGRRERRRRPLSETRARLLDAATTLVVDSGINATLGVIDLETVCHHAGLTSAGSAYKIWDTKEAFRVDLLRHLMRVSTPGPAPADAVREAAEASGPPTLTEAIRSIAHLDLADNAEPRALETFIALWLSSFHDPDLARALAQHEDAALGDFADCYEFALDVFDREWVPPFDARKLAVVLSSLVTGMTIRGRVTPERTPDDILRPTGADGTMQQWHLFACAAQVIIEAFSRPTGHHPPG